MTLWVFWIISNDPTVFIPVWKIISESLLYCDKWQNSVKSLSHFVMTLFSIHLYVIGMLYTSLCNKNINRMLYTIVIGCYIHLYVIGILIGMIIFSLSYQNEYF